MTAIPKVHAVREFHVNDDEVDAHVEEITRVGYTILKNALTDDELADIRGRIDRIYEQQLEEIGGEAALQRINDAGVARCLIGYDHYFLKLATEPTLLAINRKLLGERFCLMSQNAIINPSDDQHYQSTWHRDLNYQHFVSSRPLAMSALYAIDEFSEVTGATRLAAATHLKEVFPSFEYLERHEISMNVPAGSVLVFDAMVYHRSGVNRSGRVRRAVNHIFTLPLIKQQISLPKMLRGAFADDPFLRGFLGYDTETGDSALRWREFKLGRVARASE
jgi:ectoine hydroxylase-related dioxygenase (phytanoyl-CoA dioxygenase family)